MPTRGRTLRRPRAKRRRVENRPNAYRRGYGPRWQKARVHFLRKHPLCVRCGEAGRLEPATVVDHITPHRGNMEVFWDRDNWQGLCETCHNRKTATEDRKYRPVSTGGTTR